MFSELLNAKHLSSHHRLRCGWRFPPTSLWFLIFLFFTSIKKVVFLTMKEQKERGKNRRGVKFKQLSGFISGRGGAAGHIRLKCNKKLLTNWKSINSLPVSAGPSCVCLKERLCFSHCKHSSSLETVLSRWQPYTYSKSPLRFSPLSLSSNTVGNKNSSFILCFPFKKINQSYSLYLQNTYTEHTMIFF